MLKKNISLAVIAARKDSKGIKNKNLIKINNVAITKIAANIKITPPSLLGIALKIA